jgi:hypothetical protein
VSDLFRDGGSDLEAAGARTDQRNPLARDVDVVVPRCGVETRAVKRCGTGEFGNVGTVELADRGDDSVGFQRLCPGRRAHGDGPAVVVPRGGDDFGVPPDVWAQLVAVHHIAEVVPQLGLFAGARVLLHDGETQAGLLEPDPGQHTQFTTADDDDAKVLDMLGIQRGRSARVIALQV